MVNRMSQQEENEGLEVGEQEEEPVFIMTDEWREFFAKSDAKRRLGSSNSISLFFSLCSFFCFVFFFFCLY